jgi:hypothetical protein
MIYVFLSWSYFMRTKHSAAWKYSKHVTRSIKLNNFCPFMDQWVRSTPSNSNIAFHNWESVKALLKMGFLEVPDTFIFYNFEMNMLLKLVMETTLEPKESSYVFINQSIFSATGRFNENYYRNNFSTMKTVYFWFKLQK